MPKNRRKRNRNPPERKKEAISKPEYKANNNRITKTIEGLINQQIAVGNLRMLISELQ